MTEIFDSLSVVGNPVPEEDRIVHLLPSLPDSCNVLVTALEASEDVPKMAVVMERLLHEERKLKERPCRLKCKCGECSRQHPRRKVLRCHHCGKLGHIKRNLSGEKSSQKEKRCSNHKANKAITKKIVAVQIMEVLDWLLVTHCLHPVPASITHG